MAHPIILFDGVCNFCNGAVNFVIRRDRDAVFRFATLQSETGKALQEQYGFNDPQMSSFILIHEGRAYTRSAAALKVGALLPGVWKLSKVFRIIPAFVRDAVYNFIARNRYKWFGRKNACMIPAPGIRERFLD